MCPALPVYAATCHVERVTSCFCWGAIRSSNLRVGGSNPSRRATGINGLSDSKKSAPEDGALYGRLGAPMAIRVSAGSTLNSANESSVSSSGIKCAQVRSVNAGSAWPIWSETQRMFLPAAMAWLAHVCRASWRRSGRTPSACARRRAQSD